MDCHKIAYVKAKAWYTTGVCKQKLSSHPLAKRQAILSGRVTSAWKTVLEQLLATWFVLLSEYSGIDIINVLIS